MKLAAFCVTFLILNALIGVKLSLFAESESGKLLGQRRYDNGGTEHVEGVDHVTANVGQPVAGAQAGEGERQDVRHRSPNEKLALDVSESHRKDTSRTSGKLSSKLALGQELSHDRPTDLSDIFISVKTSGKFHISRLMLVVQTWFILAREQTYFFTDVKDDKLAEATGGHMINTNCSSTHTRQSLCCKFSVEFDAYLDSKKRWMCHFDDDTYVNIPVLVDLLRKYKHTEDWYLGKPSLRHPIEIHDPDNHGMKTTFWFATGSAFCISRGLALQMMPHAGAVISSVTEHLLRKQLTVIDEFRSHLEALWLIKPYQMKKQVTFSYSKYGEKVNVVNVAGFSNSEDPTRMKSIHCHLFPTFRECKRLQS